MENTNTMENNILIALEFYIPDNWYGTRKRFTSANKFRTKSEAKVALSALDLLISLNGPGLLLL